jgi:SET domain
MRPVTGGTNLLLVGGFAFLLLLLLSNKNHNHHNNNGPCSLASHAFSSPLLGRRRPAPPRRSVVTAAAHDDAAIVAQQQQPPPLDDDDEAAAGAVAATRLFRPDTSPAIQRLTQWLDEELDDCDGVGATAIGYNNHHNNHNTKNQQQQQPPPPPSLRGLYATEDYAAGEYILAIPTSACLTIYDRVYDMVADRRRSGDPEDEPEDDANNNDREAQDIRDGALALRQLLLASKKDEKEGDDGDNHHFLFWKTYLDCLPTETSHFAATPDFWDEDIIRQLEVPTLVEDMLRRKAAQQKTSSRSILDNDDNNNNNNDQQPPSLAFCAWLVRSRAFTTFQMLGQTARAEAAVVSAADDDDDEPPPPDTTMERTLRTRTVLIPYIDMLNHAPAGVSNTVMEKIETPVRDASDDAIDDDNNDNNDTSYFALVATKDIAAGDELTVTYGTGYETCLDLVAKYGFWLPNNPNDDFLDWSSVNPTQQPWSTTIERDEQELAALCLADNDDDVDGGSAPTKNDQRQRDRRVMLELRLHLKRLQQQQLAQ